MLEGTVGLSGRYERVQLPTHPETAGELLDVELTLEPAPPGTGRPSLLGRPLPPGARPSPAAPPRILA